MERADELLEEKEYTQALDWLLEGWRACQESDYKIANKLGLIYIQTEDFKKAIRSLKTCLKLIQDLLDDKAQKQPG